MTTKTTRPLRTLWGRFLENPLPYQEITFNDDFAPSFSALQSDDPRIHSKRGRFLFYNQHADIILVESVFRAVELGCPAITVEFPFGFAFVDAARFKTIGAVVGELVEKLEEGSLDWLKLLCYHTWAEVSAIATGDLPGLNHAHPDTLNLFIMEKMFRLGATCREIELHALNKNDADSRRKQKRSLADSNEGRDMLNRERKEMKKLKMEHAAKVLSELKLLGTDAHKAREIHKNWCRVDFENGQVNRPAVKTIQNWLAAAKKQSRTRSRSG